MVKLLDLAKVIRSKNSGPYELTLDIILKDEASYRLLIEKQCITKEVISNLYHIPLEDVINVIHFEPAHAIKATIVRVMCSGDLNETDVYGAQQHAPLLQLEFDIELDRKV